MKALGALGVGGETQETEEEKKGKQDGTKHEPLIYSNSVHSPGSSIYPVSAPLRSAATPSSETPVGCLCEEQQWSLCYLPEGSSHDAAVSLISW